MSERALQRRSIVWVSGLQIFPPLSGGHLRSAGLVTALARQGFDVSIYSLIGRSADYRAGKVSEQVVHGPHLREFIDRRRSTAAVQFASYRFDVMPLWIEPYLRFHRPQPLAEWLGRADAVIADFPFLSSVLPGLGKPTVLNTHNVEHRLVPERGYHSLVRERVRRLELRAARRCDLLCACSREEAEFFTQAGARDVLVVPNGVDLERFRIAAGERARVRAELGIADDETMLLFAASKFGPNREAYDWLTSAVARFAAELESMKVRVVVVGSVVPAPVRQGPLQALGFVDKVEPYFAAADFGFNPLFTGAGTNVKMADFIAARLPILTTSFGTRGYDLNGDDVLIFSADQFLPRVQQAVQLTTQQRQQMAERAWQANRNVVDTDAVVAPLADWLQKAIAQRAETRKLG